MGGGGRRSRRSLRRRADRGGARFPAGPHRRLVGALDPSENILAWQTLLDRPACQLAVAPPEPRPPVAARPRRLSVTQIETWMRDPYGIYARHILRLRALEPLDADPGAAERGT